MKNYHCQCEVCSVNVIWKHGLNPYAVKRKYRFHVIGISGARTVDMNWWNLRAVIQVKSWCCCRFNLLPVSISFKNWARKGSTKTSGLNSSNITERIKRYFQVCSEEWKGKPREVCLSFRNIYHREFSRWMVSEIYKMIFFLRWMVFINSQIFANFSRKFQNHFLPFRNYRNLWLNGKGSKWPC